jgi:hypothetical protein
MVPRHLLLVAPIGLALTLSAPLATAQQPAPSAVPAAARPSPTDLAAGSLITDGTVFELVRAGDRIYATGGFQTVGRYAGPGALLDGASGDPLAGPEIADGQISVVISDGAGGWYLGGDFSRIGGQPAGGLAHVLADGTLDDGFLPVADGLVSAVALQGGTLYVGGDFRHVDGTARDGLAAVSTTDGSLLPFTHAEAERVTELVASPSAVYVGSDHLVALDPLTGAALPGFSSPVEADVQGGVRALALGDGRLYVGTDRLVALDPVTGARDTGFAVAGSPEDYRSYHALLVTDDVLYAGSDRDQPLLALDPATGAADPAFAPSFGGQNSTFPGPTGVYDLALDGDRLWAAGSFTSAGGASAHGLAVLDTTTGARTDTGLPSYDRQVNAVELSGDRAYVGGTFSMTRWSRTNGLAALDATTLDPVPGFRVAPYAYGDLAVSPSALYVAPNHFQGFDKRPDSPHLYYSYRSRISAFDPETGTRLPDLTRSVRNLSGVTVIGDRLYVARRLEGDVKFPRNAVDVYDGTGRLVRSFDVPLRGYVTTLETIRGDLLVAGSFKRSTRAGYPRNTALLRLDPRTGARRGGFDPKIHGPVYDVVVQGSSIYASGLFHQVFSGFDGDRPGLVKLDPRSQNDQTFAPDGFAGNRVLVRLTAAGDVVFVAGSRPRFVDATTGARVDSPNGAEPWTVDAITTTPGGHAWAGRLHPNLGGRDPLPLGFISLTAG